jgi:putative addiction module component (TIGR02574 family)
MATELEKVVEQALSLPGLERLSVARQILESVEPQASEEVERAWEEEIVKRVEKLDCGTAKFRPWEEIKQDFDSRFPR